MTIIKKISVGILLTFFVLLYATDSCLLHAQVQSSRAGYSSNAPQPRLIRPTSEIVNIQDKKGILFKWSSQQIPSGGRRKYRFQLYEGYNMYKQNLIFKEELDPQTFEIFIEKDMFKNNTTYTWSIRQRGFSSSWSRRNFYSFKVLKDEEEIK